MRKTNLDRLLRGRPDGILVNPFETGAIGPDLYRKACEFGLEGLSQSAVTARTARQVQRLDKGEEPAPSSDGAVMGALN
jgi:hypothetical protein